MRFLVSFFLFLWLGNSMFSQIMLEGIVRNERGEKLSFATVHLLNTSFAAATDEKGYYKLSNIPEGEYECKVTYIGYYASVQKISLHSNTVLDVVLNGEIYRLDQIEIQANRSGEKGPFTKTNLSKATLQKENLGQDVPYLLQWTPSMVVTSDAGTGIGYTSMRLRGSDQTRINVTINGVPLNDAESQNVFWVDLPDLIGSVKNIQIQRGVGTSSNGAGAFGGTVSISTHDHRVNPYVDLSGGFGSFNTRKLQVSAGTGLINGRYFAEGRGSFIKSDGYIDRATADLSSLYFSAGRVSDHSSLRLNILSGKEVTYQAWYGTPESKLLGNSESLLNHFFNNQGSIYKNVEDSLNLFNSDRKYNYYTYPNQVDNYRQTHYQLIWSSKFSDDLKIKSTFFYTKGKGYFEEFRVNDKFENYRLTPVVKDGSQIVRADIVRRRWLDNDFYGWNADAEYKISDYWAWSIGINLSKYAGKHFGNVLRTSVLHPDHSKTQNYYDNRGDKTDYTAYTKLVYLPSEKLSVHADIQWRKVNYTIYGSDNDLRDIDVSYAGDFLNPKLGINYQISKEHGLYLSYAFGQKEPSRGDFIDRAFATTPKAEKLHNVETGLRTTYATWMMEHSLYYMRYRDQLVLTGELNDVGAPIRVNVPVSTRLGWESSITYSLSKYFSMHTNFTLSTNKIKEFEEVIADYTNGFEKKSIQHNDTDISFSPAVTGALQILYKPTNQIEIELSSKYVSKQYLDNTSNPDRQMPAYHFQNLRMAKSFESKWWKHCKVTILVNNLLNKHFVSNGYTYTYIYEKPITENFYYPQAGINFLAGVQLGF